MNVLRLTAATLASATASLICIATLPLAGYESTLGLWLMTIGIAAGLLAICAAVLRVVRSELERRESIRAAIEAVGGPRFTPPIALPAGEAQ